MAKTHKESSNGKPGTALATLAPDAQDEQRKVAEMAAPLRPVYREMKAEVGKMLAGNLQAHYHIGELAQKVISKSNTYGTQAIPQCAEALGDISTNTLYEAARVTQTYSWAKVEQISKRMERVGLRLGWSHIRALTYVKGPNAEQRRLKVEKRLCTGRLSIRELFGMVHKQKPKNPKAKKILAPKTPTAACHQITKYAETMLTLRKGWDKALFGFVESASPDNCTEDLLESVRKTSDLVLSLQAELTEVSTDFGKAIARLERVLTRKEELEEAARKRDKKDKGTGRTKRPGGRTNPRVTEPEKPEIDLTEEPEPEPRPKKKKPKAHSSAKPRPHHHTLPSSDGGGKKGPPESVKARIARAKAKVGR